MKFILCVVITVVVSSLKLLSNANLAPDCRIVDDSSLHSFRVNLTPEEKEQLEVEGQCFLACAIMDYKVNKVRLCVASKMNNCTLTGPQAAELYYRAPQIIHPINISKPVGREKTQGSRLGIELRASCFLHGVYQVN